MIDAANEDPDKAKVDAYVESLKKTLEDLRKYA